MLSLTPQQLEMLCGMYHQILEAPAAIERIQKGLPRFAERMTKARPSGFVPTRLILNFIRNPTKEMMAKQLRTESGIRKASDRQLDRHLAYLLESKCLLQELHGKACGVCGTLDMANRGTHEGCTDYIYRPLGRHRYPSFR